MNRNITDSIIYIGANDHDIDLFEGQYIVPNGMAYNSYAVVGEKIAIMDTIDQRKTGEGIKTGLPGCPAHGAGPLRIHPGVC